MIYNKIKVIPIFILILSSLFMSCSDVKIKDTLLDPIPSGATGRWSGVWVLYDDELKTGGGIMFYTEPAPSNPNSQTIDLSCTEYPYSGNKCLKYSWDGSESYDSTWKVWQNKWCGMALIVGSDWTQVNTSSKDVSLAGYKKLTFKARGIVDPNVNVRIEAMIKIGQYSSSPAGVLILNSNTLTSDWSEYTIELNNVSTINIFLSVVFIYSGNQQSSGATIYLDDITLSN